MTSPELLELETRRTIYNLVLSQPGLHLREIQRQLEMHVNLVEYHLHHLVASELVVSVQEGGYNRFFPSQSPGSGGSVDRLTSTEKRILGLLRQPMPLRIMVYLLAAGTTQHKDVCDHLGCAPSTLTYHMKKLVKAGVVGQRTAGEGKGYSLVDRRGVARLLMMYRPAPFDQVDAFSELWLDLSQEPAPVASGPNATSSPE
jgi:predicted transcriptional regulator